MEHNGIPKKRYLQTRTNMGGVVLDAIVVDREREHRTHARQRVGENSQRCFNRHEHPGNRKTFIVYTYVPFTNIIVR